jgi:NhaP-type Na+/H+ or K+/H+ antiporter
VLLVVRLRQLPSTQRRLVAWFGIRGVGSLFYLALVVDSGLDAGIAGQLVDATLPAIALSVLLHGISATPLMGWYQRRHVRQRREKRLAARRASR